MCFCLTILHTELHPQSSQHILAPVLTPHPHVEQFKLYSRLLFVTPQPAPPLLARCIFIDKNRAIAPIFQQTLTEHDELVSLSLGERRYQHAHTHYHLVMSPAEIGTRVEQSFSRRWSNPPACRLIPSSSTPAFPEPPPYSVEQAEKICKHRFDLLGYKDLDYGTPIDWHFDPVHNKRAPRKPWHEIPFLDFDRIGDHKVIWELNRHQHLVTLAQAGLRDELVGQWTHWQRENPYPIGINWASTLEVAFRALSWLWVRHLIGNFHPDLLSALHLHGWYIERFLSTYFSPNTHLLGEGVALFAIGTTCPQIADAPRWQVLGWKILLQQAEAQVRPDGFHFEQSVYYHIYALDFFRFARELAAKNGIAIPESFDRTIARMSDALAAISQAGRPPNFGDDDGGHVIGGQASAASRTAVRQQCPSVRRHLHHDIAELSTLHRCRPPRRPQRRSRSCRRPQHPANRQRAPYTYRSRNILLCLPGTGSFSRYGGPQHP